MNANNWLFRASAFIVGYIVLEIAGQLAKGKRYEIARPPAVFLYHLAMACLLAAIYCKLQSLCTKTGGQ